MALKKIINDKPKVGDVSQYNFDDGYSTTPPNHNDSTGLPENNDKFQNKDLFTNCVGDKLNEAIIEKNLKFYIFQILVSMVRQKVIVLQLGYFHKKLMVVIQQKMGIVQ